VDPADLIRDFGADIVRLWAASSDYHADVRCSTEIFKQISQNYLKFRNTCKFLLDNLVGFDAERLVAPADMLPIDRWIMTKLNALIEKAAACYDKYEFHVISHAINDFCVVDLSSFYMDIIKDRLYCEEAEGLNRRSAQTAMFLVLDAMTRIFAPILAFTCNEVWLAMPHRAGDDERNVLLNVMVKPYTEYALSDAEMAQWAVLAQLRSSVNSALEAARNEKKIGKSLEAHVTLVTEGAVSESNLAETKAAFEDTWADLFIVSDVEVVEDKALFETAAETALAGVRVLVSEAKGEKCQRCWKHSAAFDAETGLCPRCHDVVSKIPALL
jgi:isoleucyl-tRNA synthetase